MLVFVLVFIFTTYTDANKLIVNDLNVNYCQMFDVDSL